MKIAITYLLLFAYSTSALKPLLPYAKDAMAHIFWYSQHIATVHEENGKYHVHYETIDAAKESAQEKSSTTTKPTSFSSEHIFSTESSYAFFIEPIINKACDTYTSQLLTKSAHADDPPPKM